MFTARAVVWYAYRIWVLYSLQLSSSRHISYQFWFSHAKCSPTPKIPLLPKISIFARSTLSVSVINVLHNHAPPHPTSPFLLQFTLAHLPATHPSPLPLQTLHTRNSAKRTLILLHQRFLTLQFVAARRAEDRMLTSCGGVGQGCDVGCCGYGDAINR
jgi:hypothetical protein